MIYGFYTQDNKIKIEEIKNYIKQTYLEDVVEYNDIDWDTGSDQSQYYTFFDIKSDKFDQAQTEKDLITVILKLNGNQFYTVTEYVPVVKDYTNIIEHILQAKAKEYNYDSIISATSYTNSTNPTFKKESLAFVEWRDQLWGPILDKVKLDLEAGTPPLLGSFEETLPTYESVLATITV